MLGGGAIPVNDGLYRPIRRIDVPYGSFLNPSQPVAVRARNNACHRVYNVIMLAMSEVVISAALRSAASRSSVETISAWRFSVERRTGLLGMMLGR